MKDNHLGTSQQLPDASLTPSRPEDISTFVEQELQHASLIHQNSPEEHQAFIDDPSVLHLSLWTPPAPTLVGHALLTDVNDPAGRVEFRRILIYEKGRGYGKLALNFIKQQGRELLGWKKIWLDVYPHNDRAIRLYSSQGFQQVATKDGLLIMECGL